MRWGYFDGSSTIAHVDVVVSDDGDLAVDNWQENAGADEFFVALVIRVNSHRYVTKHGLRTGGGNYDLANFVQGWVGNFPQDALLCFMFDLNVSKTCLVDSTVVNDSFTSVDQIIFPHLSESVVHCLYHLIIQGKCKMLPGGAGAQGA